MVHLMSVVANQTFDVCRNGMDTQLYVAFSRACSFRNRTVVRALLFEWSLQHQINTNSIIPIAYTTNFQGIPKDGR
jgi:hypothetical protein